MNDTPSISSCDFKNLANNYQKFIEILNEKIHEQCNQTLRYNAFYDKEQAYSSIIIEEDVIKVSVYEGEKYFDYEIPIEYHSQNNIELSANFLEWSKLKIRLALIRSNLSYEQNNFKHYLENISKFQELLVKYGTNDSMVDATKHQLKIDVFQNQIKKLEQEESQIMLKIEDLKSKQEGHH